MLDQIDLAIHEGELLALLRSIRVRKIDLAQMSDRFGNADHRPRAWLMVSLWKALIRTLRLSSRLLLFTHG